MKLLKKKPRGIVRTPRFTKRYIVTKLTTKVHSSAKNTIFHNDNYIRAVDFNTVYRYNNHRNDCTRTQAPLYGVSLLTKLYPSPSVWFGASVLIHWLHCNVVRMHSFSRGRDSGAFKVSKTLFRRMLFINVQQIQLS